MATKTHPATTTIHYDDDGTDPYTQLKDIIEITPPDMEWGSADITPLEGSNPSGTPSIGTRAKEFASGWQDSGQIDISVYFTRAQLATLIATAFDSTSKESLTLYWRIMFPLIDAETTNSKLEFQGFIQNWNWDAISRDNDDHITMNFTIKISGDVTFTAGS